MSAAGHQTGQEDSATREPLTPLNLVPAGGTVRIRQLCASPETSCRLREIGLGEGQIIRLIASHANIICQVCNARLALSNVLANTIWVESLNPRPS